MAQFSAFIKASPAQHLVGQVTHLLQVPEFESTSHNFLCVFSIVPIFCNILAKKNAQSKSKTVAKAETKVKAFKAINITWLIISFL